MVTNYIKGASYKEVYDLHTDSESTSILTVHSPVTNLPRQMLGGFFKQYRRFKYRGAKVSLRPAATLPADPEQISYGPGDTGIDPRDMLNPILTRGYCGESLGTFLNAFMTPGVQRVDRQPAVGDPVDTNYSDGFTGSSVDRTSFIDNYSSGDYRSYYLEKLYYQSLSDPGFRKIRMQRTYGRFFRPLVYELATNTQYLAKPQQAGMVSQAPANATTSNIGTYLTAAAQREYSADIYGRESDYLHDELFVAGDNKVVTNSSGSSNFVRAVRVSHPILTSHKRPLGWLDTDTVVTTPGKVGGGTIGTDFGTTYADYLSVENTISGLYDAAAYKSETVLPLINMGIFILPKAYKQEMFYRLSITHVFDFKDFRPLRGLVSPFDDSAVAGGSLEWDDWDDNQIVEAGPSVTSTSKNFELVDVLGSGNENLDSE